MLSFTKADNETDKLSIKAKLTAGFKANILGIAKSDMEMHASLGLDFESKSYSSESQTLLITKGGPDVNKLFSQSPDGNKLSVDSVVGLTREGIPLFNLIHQGVLNGYDPKTMRMVQDLIYNATQEYYKHNTIPGCNDVHRNYFYKANIYDGQCLHNSDNFYNYVIGGVFQKCEYISSSSERHPTLPNGNQCDEYKLPNPFTKNYTCMEGFDEIGIESFYVTFQNRIHSLNDSKCNGTVSKFYFADSFSRLLNYHK
uniref:Uncharacterized protein n=1 Tax=Panagrolaimus davidi TaxID=227884 RepID=A0A914QEC8_9BILA